MFVGVLLLFCFVFIIGIVVNFWGVIFVVFIWLVCVCLVLCWVVLFVFVVVVVVVVVFFV